MTNVLMLLDKEFPADDRVEKEACSLIQHGFKVTILCPTFEKRPINEVHKEIDILRFHIKKRVFYKLLGLIQLFPFYKLLWLSKVKQIIKEKNIAVIHMHDLPLCCLIKPLKKKSNLKFVADMHENYPAMVAGQEHMRKIPNKFLISIKRWYALEVKWLEQADFIICTASGMINRLKGQLSGAHQFVLVPNTLDVEEFAASQIRDTKIEKKFTDTINILSYGVVSEQRGIQFVIAAMGKIKNKLPKLRLIVLGDGSYLQTLKELAKSHNVEKHIVFEGWQSQSKLISYMENTHITVIPHIKSEHTDNTSPNKLFHFMYFKKPIIASDCNYIKEIVEEEQCGIIYPFDDTSALAEVIERLYISETERKKMGENGFKAILSKYNWQTTVAPMIEKYPRI